MEPDKDFVIIGAGAAGLAAAQYGARANLRTLVIEKMAAGGQALLIDDLENYPGFPETVGGYEFAQKMEKQAKNFGAQFQSGTVKEIKKEGDLFRIVTTKGEITSYTVLLATGAEHRKLGVPGEKEFSGRGVSYCATCDGPFFKGKKMLVVGGGDAACDEATFLAKLTDQVVMIHRRDRFRAQRSLAERVTKNESIDVRFNTVLKEIKGDQKVNKVVLENSETGETYEEEMDAVFIFIGSIPQTQLVPDAKKDEAGNIVADQKMQSSIPGLFAAGDVRDTPFRQLIVSASDGAISAHIASQYIDDLKGEAYEDHQK